MTVPSAIGSAVLIQDDDDISQSVTVPSGADTCILFIGGWDSGGNAPSPVPTLAGDDFTIFESIPSAAFEQIHAYYLNNPTSGSQTFVASFPSVWPEGVNVYLTYWQDVDTSGSPITGSDEAYRNDAGNIETAAFATDTNDLVICAVSTYAEIADAAPSGSGQTEILDSGVFNDAGMAIGTKAGSSGTTTMQGENAEPGIVGLSLTGSVAGGATIPVMMHHYRQQGMSY